MHRAFRLAAAALLLPLLHAPASAQEPSAREVAQLRTRTRAFLHAAANDSLGALRAYFPRRGEWTWIQSTHGDRVPKTVGTWRFRGEETLRAISNGAPICHSFVPAVGEGGPLDGSLGWVLEGGTDWRHVRGTRFAPRASRFPYTYVEWKREDGQWVIATLADEAHVVYKPRLLGVPVDTLIGRRDVPRKRSGSFVATEAYAEGERWFKEYHPIMFDGSRYFMYGLTRALPDGELARIGTFGRVGIYVEAGTTGRADVIYIPERPGEYRPYQTFEPSPCYRG